MTSAWTDQEIEGLPETSFLRVRVLSQRVSIEWIAADAYSKATGSAHRQSRIPARLLALTSGAPTVSPIQAVRIVRLATYTYRRASDVLHGRSTMLAINSQVVDEWEQIVDDLAELHRLWVAARIVQP